MPLGGEKDDLASFDMTPSATVARIEQHPELVRRLIDLFLSYVLTGNPQASKQYQPDERYLPLFGRWATAMKTFIVAHDFGHLPSLAYGLGKPIPRMGFRQVPAPRRQEAEADFVGAYVTFALLYESGSDPPLTCLAIHALLRGMETMERVLAHFNGVDFADDGGWTHLPFDKRRANLLGAIHRICGQREYEEAARLVFMIDRLFEQIEPEVMKAAAYYKTQGAVPHPKWAANRFSHPPPAR